MQDQNRRCRHTIAVTGHRPSKLGGYDPKYQDRLGEFMRLFLYKKRKNVQIITGMALGFDQIVADVCLRLKIPFLAAVPFKGQESIWGQQTEYKYNALLNKAVDVVYVSKPGYTKQKMLKRNHWMVNNSDIVLALWDGTGGGTSECVNYAKKQGKRVVNLWSKWLDYQRDTVIGQHHDPRDY